MSAIKKIAIVTGASRGIGYATASLFVDKGWQVITCSREGEIKFAIDIAPKLDDILQ